MSYCSHDPSAAMVEITHNSDGITIRFIHFEEGMLSRRKKSYHFPSRSVSACLDYFDIPIEAIDTVTTDFMDFESFVWTSDNYRQLVGDYIRKNLRIRNDQIVNPIEHHEAHALGSWIGSGYEDSAFLAIDGLGSRQSTHSVFISENGVLKKIFSQTTPGIGALYNLITQLIGFKSGEEGKVMGLAPFGLKLQNRFDYPKINFHGVYRGLSVDYSGVIRRSPDLHLINDFGINLSKKHDLYADYRAYLAFKLQQELETCLIHLATEISKITGKRKLCLSGGVALNCVANEALVNKGIFDEVYVFPDSADSGLPIGLAFSGALKTLERFKDKNLGEKIEGNSEHNSINLILRNYKHPKFAPDSAVPLVESKLIEGLPWLPLDLNIIIQALMENCVVALFYGGFEYGPRALGRRSFIANATTVSMKKILNEKIKHRELYRPFAPICLPEEFDKYFTSKHLNHEYMSFAVSVTDESKEKIPAVVHVDQTARVQISSEDCGLIHEILKLFKRETGCGVLINTSLNDNDEPIVLDIYDAVSCFLRTNSDVLIVNDKMLFRNKIQFLEEQIKVKLTAEIKSRDNIRFNNSLTRIMKKELEPLSKFNQDNFIVTEYSKKFRTKYRLRNLVVDIKCKKLRKFSRLISTAEELEIICENLAEFKFNLEDLAIECVRVNSEPSTLDTLRTGDLLISYNLSNLYRDYVVLNHIDEKGVENFYRSSDYPLRKNNSTLSELHMVLDQIANTYENSRSLEIEDFFTNSI